MKRLFLAVAASIAIAPTVGYAQTAPAAAETLDPARLAAAKALLDVIVPPAMRDGMIDSMMQPMMANMQQSMMANPRFQQQISSDPKLRAIFDAFMARQNARTLATLRTGLPGMFDAMTRAYARRFTVDQMSDARAFFSTPSGRVYMEQGMTIMSDPDVQAWQRQLMSGSMDHVQDDIAKLVAEVEAAEKAK